MKLDDLQTALLKLRAAWPDLWPGMPRVLAACLAQLGHAADAVAPGPAAAVHACMQDLAEAIETDGRCRLTQGLEPAYHNRLHMADTLVSLTALLLETRQDPGETRLAQQQPAHAEWLAMLAMLGHDFHHDGTINKTPSELERRSVSLLAPLLERHGVSAEDSAVVNDLILLTDPTQVSASHQKIVGRPFAIHDLDCLAVLVQEADILASTLPGIGQGLTQQLAQEWALFDTPRARHVLTGAGRMGFLRFGALFSSPASQRLGLAELRAAQISSLETVAAAA